MVRCEFHVLVCVCRFLVDSDRNGVVTIPLDECVQEWEFSSVSMVNLVLG